MVARGIDDNRRGGPRVPATRRVWPPARPPPPSRAATAITASASPAAISCRLPFLPMPAPAVCRAVLAINAMPSLPSTILRSCRLSLSRPATFALYITRICRAWAASLLPCRRYGLSLCRRRCRLCDAAARLPTPLPSADSVCLCHRGRGPARPEALYFKAVEAAISLAFGERHF